MFVSVQKTESAVRFGRAFRGGVDGWIDLTIIKLCDVIIYICATRQSVSPSTDHQFNLWSVDGELTVVTVY